MFYCLISQFILILNLAWFHCLLQDALLSFSLIHYHCLIRALLSFLFHLCSGFPGAEAQIPLLLHVSMAHLPPFSYCIQTRCDGSRERAGRLRGSCYWLRIKVFLKVVSQAEYINWGKQLLCVHDRCSVLIVNQYSPVIQFSLKLGN